MTGLGSLPGYPSSSAYGINADGLVVGTCGVGTYPNEHSCGFSYSNGKMTAFWVRLAAHRPPRVPSIRAERS